MGNEKQLSTIEIDRMRKERERKVSEGISILENIIKRYPLNKFLALLTALNWPGNLASQYLDRKIGQYRSTGLMFQIYIPALAKFAILNGSDLLGQSDLNFENAFNDITRCISIINDVKDYIPFELSQDFDFAFSALQFHLANQHYRFQGNVQLLSNMIARSFTLFRDIPNEKYADLNISSIFEDIYGINQSRFFIISAKLMGIKQSDWFNFENFYGLDRMAHGLSTTDLELYFERLSLDYQGFKNEATDVSKSFIGQSSQFYGYSPFDRYPILRREDKFLILSQHYLIWCVYLPIYFDLLKYFTEKEGSKNNSFSTSFGFVFQDYVGIQLKQLNDSSKILNEIKYGKSKKDFTDWSILYEKEMSAILLEVKKHLIPLKAKYLMDKESLEATLISTIVRGLKQIHRKIKALSSKEKGLEVFESCTKFFPVIITFDDSYLLNNYFIRSIIDSKLINEGIKFKYKWQILTIRELEQVAPSCDITNSFLSLLELKVKDDKLVYLDWDKYLIDMSIEIKENKFLKAIIRKELEG